MVAGFSDRAGRRPGYFICLVIFIASNIGLCLQNSYPALLILRCIQSAGSSGTSALSSGIVGDLVTNEERGKFLAFASIGSMLGTTVSPIIGMIHAILSSTSIILIKSLLGGLISDYLDWHWLFWFLLFLSWSFVPLLLVLPETCRKVVSNLVLFQSLWQLDRWISSELLCAPRLALDGPRFNGSGRYSRTLQHPCVGFAHKCSKTPIGRRHRKSKRHSGRNRAF